MKNLRIVSEGVENVSSIDTYLLRILLDSYKKSLVHTETRVIVGRHLDNLRENMHDIKAVVRLNDEFNRAIIFNDVLMRNKDYSCFEVDEKNE